MHRECYKIAHASLVIEQMINSVKEIDGHCQIAADENWLPLYTFFKLNRVILAY